MERAFLFQFETFNEFKKALEEIFSPSVAVVILFTTARKCGIKSCKEIMRHTSTREEALAYLAKLKREKNWGEISFQNVDFTRGVGRVIVTNSFETIMCKGKSACCHFFRGFLTGFLSELFSRNILVTEEKCAGKGDEYCEFVFR